MFLKFSQLKNSFFSISPPKHSLWLYLTEVGLLFCRWRDVKLRAFDHAKHRTYVDLKVWNFSSFLHINVQSQFDLQKHKN